MAGLIRSGIKRSWRWVAAIAGTLLSLGAIWLLLSDARTAGDQRVDARRTVCLSTANRQRFLEVIRNTGAGEVDSKTGWIRTSTPKPGAVTVEAWSRSPKQGFDRACIALVTVTNRPLLDPAPSSAFERLITNPAMNLVAGGALTFLFGRLTARSDRRQTLSDALNSAGTGYLNAAEERIGAILRLMPDQDPPDPAPLEARKTELWFAIQHQAANPALKLLVRDRLDDVQKRLTATWPKDRAREAAEVRKDLETLRSVLIALNERSRSRSKQILASVPGGLACL
jgi:hypothetical protein